MKENGWEHDERTLPNRQQMTRFLKEIWLNSVQHADIAYVRYARGGAKRYWPVNRCDGIGASDVRHTGCVPIATAVAALKWPWKKLLMDDINKVLQFSNIKISRFPAGPAHAHFRVRPYVRFHRALVANKIIKKQ